MGETKAAVYTPLNPVEVMASLRKAWVARFGDEPRPESIALLMAQIALETGLARCVAWNLGNEKTTPNGSVDRCFFATHEVVPSAIAHKNAAADPEHIVVVSDDGVHARVLFKPDHPATCFRAFNSLDEGVASHFRTIASRFSRAWPAVRAGDARMFATLLRAQGYYTAPLEDYARGLEARFEMYMEPPLATAADVTRALEKVGYHSVREFQLHSNLDVDGVVGPLTRRALRKALAAT